MKDEKNDILRIKIIFLLSIIASILMIIFTIPKAHALQIKYPDLVSGNKYGYRVPTRNIKLENNTNYVNVALARNVCNNNNVDNCTVNNVLPYEYGRVDIKNYVLPQYILDSDDSLRASDYYTSSINTSRTVGSNYYEPFKYFIPYWGFHPSSSVNSPIEMFESNEGIYYSGDYTYDFDIIFFNQLGLLNTDINNYFEGCDYWKVENGVNYYGCGSSYFNFSVQTIKKDGYYQHYKISTNYFNNYGKAGFNQIGTWVQDGVNSHYDNVKGWRLNPSFKYRNIGSSINGNIFTEIYISRPYNIVYYTSESQLTCSDRCVSNQDAQLDDNNDGTGIYDTTTNGFINSINGFINRDYGFVGIVNKTFDFITNLLNASKSNSCYSTYVDILGQRITLPCGRDFWNRQDMQTFNTTYNLVFIGAVAYLLAWKIYKNLLSAFNPSDKIVEENEVDGL